MFHNQGKIERAREAAERFLTLLGHPEAAEAIRRGYAEGGYPRAMQLAADLLAERSASVYIQPTEIARLYAYAGDRDRAFAWLDREYETRDTWMTFLNSDPRFDSLHTDPRFDRLRRRMNVPR